VQIDSGAFKDSAGNSYAGIGDNTTWNFTTSSAAAVTSISISSTGGSDNTLIVGEFLEVTVVFDLDITVTGLPYVPVVLTNATRNASYHSGSGGTTLVFRYQIASGDIDADGASIVTNTLNSGGGTLTNSGVNADLSHSAVAAVDGVDEVEGVAPTATLAPVDNATGVSITANLILTFSESVTAQSSGANRSIEIFRSDGTSIETIAADNAKVTVSGSTVTINPAATLLNSTGYYVQVGSNSFKDAAGNAYDGIGDSSKLELHYCSYGCHDDHHCCDDHYYHCRNYDDYGRASRCRQVHDNDHEYHEYHDHPCSASNHHLSRNR